MAIGGEREKSEDARIGAFGGKRWRKVEGLYLVETKKRDIADWNRS